MWYTGGAATALAAAQASKAGLAAAGRACMSLAGCARPAALWPGLPWTPGLRVLRPARGVLGSRRPLCDLAPRLPFSPPISGLHHHLTHQPCLWHLALAVHILLFPSDAAPDELLQVVQVLGEWIPSRRVPRSGRRCCAQDLLGVHRARTSAESLLCRTWACWKHKANMGAVALKQGAHGGAEAGPSQSAARSQP